MNLTISHAKKLVLCVGSDLEEEVKVWQVFKVAPDRGIPNRLKVGVSVIIGRQISRVLLMF